MSVVTYVYNALSKLARGGVKMTGKLLWGLLSMALVIIGGVVTGCAELSPSASPTSLPLSPPSSSYPVDIIGRVTIANSVITDIKGKIEPTTHVKEFWIVQTSIRNKAFKFPVTSTDHWLIMANPDCNLSEPNCLVGQSIGNVFQSPVTIQDGQSSEMMIGFGVFTRGLNPSDYQICLKGHAGLPRIADSYGKLVNSNIIAEVYDWDSQKVVQVGKRMSPTTEPTEETFTIQGYVSQPFGQSKDITLKLIKSETGDRTKVIDFKTDKSPVLVVYDYTPTSQISSNIMLWYQVGDAYGSDVWTTPFIPPWRSNVFPIEGYGKIKLKVESSRCNWWVKIGVEQ